MGLFGRNKNTNRITQKYQEFFELACRLADDELKNYDCISEEDPALETIRAQRIDSHIKQMVDLDNHDWHIEII